MSTPPDAPYKLKQMAVEKRLDALCGTHPVLRGDVGGCTCEPTLKMQKLSEKLYMQTYLHDDSCPRAKG